MLDFNTNFYQRLFQSLDNNAVLMRVEDDGTYYPIWCSHEFAEMMEGTEEDCIRMESDTFNTVHPDDQEAVSYLFRNHTTRDGANNLTLRKYTVQNNLIWVNIHYAFIKEEGVQYAYYTYTDVTEIKESQAKAEAMYESIRADLESLSGDALTFLKVNLSTDVLEDIRGSDPFQFDPTPHSDHVSEWQQYLPLESDQKRFAEKISPKSLIDTFNSGIDNFTDYFFTKRSDGRKCFVKITENMRQDPSTGDIISFFTEYDYNKEMVNQTIMNKVLVEQYDMVTSMMDGEYSVVIGDPERIKRGSIFPMERTGNYSKYLEKQVFPVLFGTEEEKAAMAESLRYETVVNALDQEEFYESDIVIDLNGETYYKRFMFYVVNRDARFYVLLKSDITDVVQERKEQERIKTIHNNMLDQINAIADDSLTVIRANMTTGFIEDVRGADLYPTDYVGNLVDTYGKTRLENLLVEADRKKYIEQFTVENMLDRTDKGLGPLAMVCYCRRASGRQCFVKFSWSASRNPGTGDVDAFGIETECNSEIIGNVMDKKVLVQQYDMVAYIVGDYYGVAIGDPSNITKGSIFPKKMDGVYMEYIRDQVIPVVSADEQETILQALSLETVKEQLENGDGYTVDVACEIDGETFNKRFNYYVVDKEMEFYILLKSDITDVLREQQARNELLANALREAEQANAAKTSFLSSMSHEIRTPMNAIIGLDNIALSDPDLSDKTREQLEKIGGSAKHLLGLINDILDMSRIESGRMTLKNEEFSFREMLEQINTMVGGQCQDKGLIYDCRILGRVDDYYIGDDMKLKQVIINILGNAVKFTPEGGTVSFIVEPVSQFEDKTTICFIMKDTGIGMDASYLPKIFDAFSQEDENKANKYGSTGLGMAITKNIVEMMNGKINVESEKGVGSTFTVTVTLKQSDRQEHESAALRPQDMHVLIIDDDPVTCEHNKLMLDEVGIASDFCLSGQEALEMLRLAHARREAYNLILVDLKMPEKNGIEVTREIRDLYDGESTIIILTAYNWDDIQEEAIAAGVDSFIAKPLFASSVLQEFQTAIQRRNITHEEVHRAELTGRHILLAEDMLINAEIMKELLDMREMEVDHAENGQIVVDMFSESPEGYYDAILMDVRMPLMTGLEATSAIRALDRPDAKTIPIIALTANAFDEDVQNSLQVGMNAHLSKPVEPDHLYETLEILIKD